MCDRQCCAGKRALLDGFANEGEGARKLLFLPLEGGL